MKIKIISKLLSYADEIHYGLADPKDVFPLLLSGFLGIVMRNDSMLEKYYKLCIKRIKCYFDKNKGVYDFNGIILPPPLTLEDEYLLSRIYSDQLHIHCKYHDDYTKIDFDRYSRAASEGPICFPIYKSAVMVEPGDIVIDCGAWIGDFSAYASFRGAAVHAFEPLLFNFQMLKKTASYAESSAGQIIPVRSAVSNSNGNAVFSVRYTGSQLNYESCTANLKNNEEIVPVTSIDLYVKDNNLPHVDFIKADIEGAERNMLEGAEFTLKKFAPKLSICTYHLPDDPIVLEKLILSANPNYVVVQKPNKLYAYVPGREKRSRE